MTAASAAATLELPVRAVLERELHHAVGGCATQNLAYAWRLDQPDAGRLCAALERVAERHEPLRSRFQRTPNGTLQRVLPATSPPLEWAVEEWTSVDVDAQVAETHGAPFALEDDLLYRLRLGRRSRTHGIVLLVVAHALWDARSTAVFARDLATAYADPAAQLPPLELQVGDVAAFERPRAVDPGACRSATAERLPLPSVGRSRLPDYEPAELLFEAAGAAVARGLDRRAAALSTTRPILLCSLFALLLSATAGVSRVPICLADANRTAPGLDALIGYLVDVDVIELDVEHSAPLRDLVAQTHAAVGAAYARGESGEQQAGGRERFLREPVPLADAFFNMVPAELARPAAGRPLLEPLALARDTWSFPSRSRPWGAQLDLELWVRPDGRLDAALSYDRRVLPADEAQRFVDGYRRAVVRAAS